MSLVEEARVVVLVADYIAADASNKLNFIGAGFQLAGHDAQTGVIAPQHVAVIVDLPAKHHDTDVSLGVELRNRDTDQVVHVPGPMESQTMRIQQVVRPMRPSMPGVWLPDTLPCRVQYLLQFPGGLPLPAGHGYYWRVELDGNHRKDWKSEFYVPGPPPGPVFGGPAGGAADVPKFPGPEDDQPSI